MGKAVVSLATGLEDAETVTVAMLMAVGAAESGRPTAMFLAKEAVRLALDGGAVGTAGEGCPPLTSLFERYAAAGGRRPAVRLPDRLQRQAAGRRWLGQGRRARRHGSPVGVDRRRGRHHLQLLSRPPAAVRLR